MQRASAMLAFILCSAPALAAPSGPAFHQAVYALHQAEIAKYETRTEAEKEQYEGVAARAYSYLETRYFDKKTGRLISRVRHDAADPTAIHIAEVNIYDDTGRLIRDYGSISLPWAPKEPVRTFINLHQYNGDLHSFRQYDVSGNVGYELCEGTFEGKPQRLSLDVTDITKEVTNSALYRACFANTSIKVADYLMPK